MGLISVFVVFVQWLIVSGSSSGSSWGTWGCIAHLQFGSASNWTAVLQMHDLRSTFVRHCVILTFALCFSWKPFESHKNQLSHKSKWVDLVLKFCCKKLAEQYSQEPMIDCVRKHQHQPQLSNQRGPFLCHIPLVHSQSGVAALNSVHARWALIKPRPSSSPPGLGLPAVCTKVIIPQTRVFPLKLWHLKPCTNWHFYLSPLLMSDCRQTRLIKSLSFWLTNNSSNQSPVIMLNVQKNGK